MRFAATRILVVRSVLSFFILSSLHRHKDNQNRVGKRCGNSFFWSNMQIRIEISSSAILHNVAVYRSLAPYSRFMAVIKSNAYGHGLPQVASLLKGHVDWFGVNSLAEALAIRETGAQEPILVMGVEELDRWAVGELNGVASTGIELVAPSFDYILELQEKLPEVRFHLKIDSGMSRLGLRGPEIQKVSGYLQDHPTLPWSGVMTHFANVEDVTDQSYALFQLERFGEALAMTKSAANGRKLLAHAASSAAAMILPEARLDMIRIGISLYGLWSSSATRLSLHGIVDTLPELKPVLRWVTRIVHLQHVEAGVSVGYGCTYRTQAPTVIAVLPVGYNEGYFRGYSNQAHVVIGGRRARVLGRVCMNMTMVDVSHIPGVRVGDDAVLIGRDGTESTSAEELAELLSTINYEVVTAIHPSIDRIIVD